MQRGLKIAFLGLVLGDKFWLNKTTCWCIILQINVYKTNLGFTIDNVKTRTAMASGRLHVRDAVADR